MSELNFLDTGGNKQKITTPVVNSLAFNTANTERVRIDSSGRVLMGSTDGATYSDSSMDDLIIGSTANGKNDGLTILSGTAQNGSIAFADSGGTSRGLVGYVHNGDYLRFNTAGVERLRINNYGLVTRPFQYHLHADRQGTLTGYDAGGSFGTPMIFNRVVSETKDSSLSSCFNTSNGLFTAPVTGVYIFNAAAYGGSGNIFGQSWFTLNGSICTATDWVINSGYAFIQNFQQIRLAAGNTVGFKPYASGQNNVTIFENNNHTYFKVSLIG